LASVRLCVMGAERPLVAATPPSGSSVEVSSLWRSFSAQKAAPRSSKSHASAKLLRTLTNWPWILQDWPIEGKCVVAARTQSPLSPTKCPKRNRTKMKVKVEVVRSRNGN